MPDNVVAVYIGGEWKLTNNPRGNEERANFVICCLHGDWSGFRTLKGCFGQHPSGLRNRPDGYFWVEER